MPFKRTMIKSPVKLSESEEIYMKYGGNDKQTERNKWTESEFMKHPQFKDRKKTTRREENIIALSINLLNQLIDTANARKRT